MTMNTQLIEDGVKLILKGLGENLQREGILETPQRVSRMYQEFFSGIDQDAKEPLQKVFKESYGEIILVKNIRFISFCEHHLLPFVGEVSLAYLPDQKVVGLSKLARMVDVVASRLQLQEKLTRQIAESLAEGLSPKGVAVVVKSIHSCMAHRGVKKLEAEMVTQYFKGVFEQFEARQNFFQLLEL